MKAKFQAAAAAATGVLSVLASSAASAAVDISAGTAESKADITTAGGLIIGVVLTIAGVSWLRRLIK